MGYDYGNAFACGHKSRIVSLSEGEASFLHWSYKLLVKLHYAPAM